MSGGGKAPQDNQGRLSLRESTSFRGAKGDSIGNFLGNLLLCSA